MTDRIAGRSTLAALLLAVACGGADRATPTADGVPTGSAARDSAGAQIVEYAASALELAPAITLDTATLAIIGVGDSSLDLSRVYEAVVLRDGGVAFFLNGAVHLYAADGSNHRIVGRDGSGPGEFREAALAWGLGDTLLATDATNSRISWIVPDRGVVRSRAVPLERTGFSFSAIGQFAGDTLIMGTGNYYPQATPVGKRVPMPVGRLTAGSDSIPVLVPLEGGEMRTVAAIGGPASVRYPPIPQAGTWGQGFLAVRPERWELNRYRPAGGLSVSVRIATTRAPVTSALRERDIAGMVALMKSRPGAPPDTSRYYTMLRELPYPDSMPAFGSVVTTPGGIAWVRDHGLTADTTWAYTAVAADGTIRGRLRGTGRKPFAFGDDRIVQRMEDQDGVVTWRVVRVQWGAPPP